MAANPWREAVDSLVHDLRQVAGDRLRSVVVYEADGVFGETPGSAGPDEGLQVAREGLVHTLVLIEGFGLDDLSRLARLATGWEKRRLAVPLILTPEELSRSLDSFPLEYGQIIAHHRVVVGDDPFDGREVNREDLRRACESQAKSHLLHLREGYLQAGTDPAKIGELISASVAPLQALLVNIARLQGEDIRTPEALGRFVEERLNLPAEALRPLVATRGDRLDASRATTYFSGYLSAAERLARLVDSWEV